MSDPTLFSDTFIVNDIAEGKYDRVSRIICTSTDNTTSFTLDINTELYPCARQENLQLVLASTLSLDGTKDDGKGWRDVGMGDATLANEFDYVMHGKVYRFQESNDGEKLQCFVSFGGLLLYLEGPFRKLNPLRIDYVYLLMKK